MPRIDNLCAARQWETSKATQRQSIETRSIWLSFVYANCFCFATTQCRPTQPHYNQMAQMASPLSPVTGNSNSPRTIERKAHFRDLNYHHESFHEFENLPSEPSSSPFVTEAPSPRKYQSPGKIPVKQNDGGYRPVRLTEDALRENEGTIRGASPSKRGGDNVSAISAPSTYAGADDTCFSEFSAVPNADMTLFAALGHSPTRSNRGSPAKGTREGDNFSPAPRPRQGGRVTPMSSKRYAYDERSPSPTPRRHYAREGDTTNLLDFTEQFSAFEQSSSRPQSRQNRFSPSKYPPQPELTSHAARQRTPSPAKQRLPPSTPSEAYRLANLIDFDLPPAPTPRSVPSISARELETLKSSFLSEISHLRATLNGKEAEVASLKNAVGDAERRVGEAQEEIRDEKDQRENLQAEKLQWEIRDKEMQGVLRGVKEEIINLDRDKESLQQKSDDIEKQRQDLEARAIEAESRAAGIQAGSDSGTINESRPEGSSGASQADVQSAVQTAVDKVARELHDLYRKKHEIKVAALKDSYRVRWEKKTRELEVKVRELAKENDELRIGRDAAMSGVVPPPPQVSLDGQNEQLEQKREDQRREQEEYQNLRQRAEDTATKLTALESEISNHKSHNADLLSQLKQSRIEISTHKSHNADLLSQLEQSRSKMTDLLSQLKQSRSELAELVAATDQMMLLSDSTSTNTTTTFSDPTKAQEQKSAGMENLKGSLSRSVSGGFSQRESRIGKIPTPAMMGRSGSGIASSIERMGRGRGYE